MKSTTIKEFKGCKELAKELRKFVKQFKNQKFSITSDYNDIRAVIIQSSEELFKSYAEYEKNYNESGYLRGFHKTTERDYNNNIQHGYQINHYYLESDCSLKDNAKEIFTKINNFLNDYHYDNSDIQSDYFDTNFYRHFEIRLKNQE